MFMAYWLGQETQAPLAIVELQVEATPRLVQREIRQEQAILRSVALPPAPLAQRE